MSKQKFSLTSELVKVEPEPKDVELLFSKEIETDNKKLDIKSEKNYQSIKIQSTTKELINFRIDIELKREFQKWCFEEGVNMSEVISDMIRSTVKKIKIK